VAIPFGRIALYSVAGLVLAGIGVSSYLWWSTRIGRFPGLEERIAEYYVLETKRQWADAYAIRVPAFRSSVPKATYVSGMERDAKDWTLKSVKILYALPERDLVRVKIRFKEVAPKGYFRIPTPEKFPGLSESEQAMVVKTDANLKDRTIEITTSDWSVWQNIDGIWYAWETGTRGHLSLNTRLVAPD
jgi:hypothetical protein